MTTTGTKAKISKTKAVREILKQTFPDYMGRKFFLDDSGVVLFNDTNWGGGTRNYYAAIRLSDGVVEKLQDFAPWANPVEGKTVEIPEGFAVVQRSYFCGIEGGITIHVKAGGHELLAHVDAVCRREAHE